MIIDHDAIVLNDAIDTMFTEAIKEKIPDIMSSAVAGVEWLVSVCQVSGDVSFRITGRFETESGKVLKADFVISQSRILDYDGAGKGWVKRCKAAIVEQIGRQLDER